MAQQVEIRIGSQTYTGKNHKAAIQAALDHLAALFPERKSEPYYGWEPVIVRAPSDQGGENVGVVYKDVNGFWSYRIHWAGGHAGSLQSGQHSRLSAEDACRRHLAQQAPLGPDALNILRVDDVEGRADHARWLRFQNDYAAARASGLSDHDAHARAAMVRS